MRSGAKKEECGRAWRIEGRRPELRVEVRGAALHRAFPHHDQALDASPFRHERMTRASRFAERDLQRFLTRRFHRRDPSLPVSPFRSFALSPFRHFAKATASNSASQSELLGRGSHFGDPLPPHPVALTSNVPIVKARLPYSRAVRRKFACDPKHPVMHRTLRSQVLRDALPFRFPVFCLPVFAHQRRNP